MLLALLQFTGAVVVGPPAAATTATAGRRALLLQGASVALAAAAVVEPQAAHAELAYQKGREAVAEKKAICYGPGYVEVPCAADGASAPPEKRDNEKRDKGDSKRGGDTKVASAAPQSDRKR